MILLRGLAASLLWILAAVVGLLGVLLSVTLILLPLGIPVLILAKKLFAYSLVVLMPGKVRHPVSTAERSTKDAIAGTGRKWWKSVSRKQKTSAKRLCLFRR